MRNSKIYLDLDGVLGGMVEAALARHDTNLPPDYTYPPGVWDLPTATGLTAAQFWGRLNDHGFWAYEIKPLPHAKDLVAAAVELVGVDRVRVLTRPTLSPFSASGKLEWLARHFPELSRRYCMAVDKTDIGRPGDTLVDDSEENCRQWGEAGGHAVLWPSPQNSRHGDTPEAAIAELRAVFDTSSRMTLTADGGVILRDTQGGELRLSGGTVELNVPT